MSEDHPESLGPGSGGRTKWDVYYIVGGVYLFIHYLIAAYLSSGQSQELQGLPYLFADLLLLVVMSAVLVIWGIRNIMAADKSMVKIIGVAVGVPLSAFLVAVLARWVNVLSLF